MDQVVNTNYPIGSVGVGVNPYDLAVTSGGDFVYVLNQRQPNSPVGSISVVDTYGSAFQVIATIDPDRHRGTPWAGSPRSGPLLLFLL